MTAPLTLETLARALGGEVRHSQRRGRYVAAPGPGHSTKDRSMSVFLADNEDGFNVYSHAGDDWREGKDLVRAKLGLGEWGPGAHPADGALDRMAERAKAHANGGSKPNGTPDEAEPNGSAVPRQLVAEFIYKQPDGTPYLKAIKYNQEPRFLQQRWTGLAWEWGKPPGDPILYRLPELLRMVHDTIAVVEGEKDADRLASLGFIATTNPEGAGKWKPCFNPFFTGKTVYVFEDNDEPGRSHAQNVARNLHGIASSVRVIRLPGLAHKGDVSDWLDAGSDPNTLIGLCKDFPEWAPANETATQDGITLNDFWAYMPTHQYIFTPSRELWTGTSVDSRLSAVGIFENGSPVVDKKGKPVEMRASAWLDRNQPVEQMTWAPGLPMLVKDRLISDGGWIERSGVTCFNLYRPPVIRPGNAAEAGKWDEHVRKVYPNDADHIIRWLAHRVQRPQEKINHALFLGGVQGIGKDSLLEPIKTAIGPWNFAEVSPQHMLGRFNGFLKSVILRVSEARDLGDVDRFAFYNHMKAYTAAPPDVLRCDEKNLREHSVLNVCGVIITSNHKADGIYLPSDDRRHYVAWSDLSKEDFTEGYWNALWGWYAEGGNQHVAAYLGQLDIEGFNPKAPPPKTAAFWSIVDANRAPEDAELADVLDRMGNPDATTLDRIKREAAPFAETERGSFGEWIRDRRNRRAIPHRLEQCGYIPVRNDAANDGLWKIHGKRGVVYVKRELSVRDRLQAARGLVR